MDRKTEHVKKWIFKADNDIPEAEALRALKIAKRVKKLILNKLGFLQ